MIHTIRGDSWKSSFSKQQQQICITALEEGHVLYLPDLSFLLKPEELAFFSPHCADSRSKNISYDSKWKKVGGAEGSENEIASLAAMLARYATNAQHLIDSLLPNYKKHLVTGRTSYRPTEIAGRKSSYRKDDTRLHVDAFPSAPLQGQRILRVFTNINPHGQNREWRLGEPFRKVVETFSSQLKSPFPGSSWLLKALNITKSRRSPYDHYMLQLHDAMKKDENYQRTVDQIEFSFPPASSWIVFTDVTSHAAMKGQYALEQTFYLPVKGMASPERAPLRILESFLGQTLV